MCRHLAYLGPPLALSRLLFDPAHALAHQASAPRDMRGGGTINADGFGVGWYPPAGPPLRYRRDQPIWTDTQLPGLAAATTAPAVLAAVRSATPGMPVTEAACAPFTGDPGASGAPAGSGSAAGPGAPAAPAGSGGGWLFSLNGRITGWPDSVAEIAAQLPVTELLRMPAPTDAALLWTLLRVRLAAGEPPAEAVAAIVAEVLTAAPGSRLNLLLTDSHTIVATTVTHALSVWHGDRAVLVSSEPLDNDPAWRPVPDGHLLVATASGVDVSPLPTPAHPEEGKP